MRNACAPVVDSRRGRRGRRRRGRRGRRRCRFAEIDDGRARRRERDLACRRHPHRGRMLQVPAQGRHNAHPRHMAQRAAAKNGRCGARAQQRRQRRRRHAPLAASHAGALRPCSPPPSPPRPYHHAPDAKPAAVADRAPVRTRNQNNSCRTAMTHRVIRFLPPTLKARSLCALGQTLAF